MKKQLVSLVLLVLFLLSGCEVKDDASQPIENVTSASASEENALTEEKEENETFFNLTDEQRMEKAQRFMETFAEKYPEYEMLDYVIGTGENDPIIAVVVARDRMTTISSFLFVVTNNGIGRLGLASGSTAFYKEDDGLRLDDNAILVSLTLTDNETKKILSVHDYKITVTQWQIDGAWHTNYKSDETIRSDSA